jgi:hypothetical protein
VGGIKNDLRPIKSKSFFTCQRAGSTTIRSGSGLLWPEIHVIMNEVKDPYFVLFVSLLDGIFHRGFPL